MSANVGAIDLDLVLNSSKFNKELKNVNTQANRASSSIASSLSKIGVAVAAAFSVKAIIGFGKECLNVATETSNAWIGLNSILVGQGKSFEKAKSFINDYISDGLVPLNNAVTTYKNLAARGYSSEQIEKTMIALKNSATFGRQSTYSLGEAVQTASEGLKNENSILVDNAGVTKNVAKMWEDYAKSIGKTTNQLTKQEKIQAEVNGILEETKFQSNDASVYTSTYSGKVAMLSQAFTNMKTAIGNVIQPIAKAFVPIITSAVNAVTKLFTAVSGLMALFGLKADSVETVSSGVNSLATDADNASDSISNIGDSAKQTAKDLKKTIAGFDEINKLEDSSSSSGGSSGSGSSTGSVSETMDVTSIIKEDTTAFNGLIERAKELASIFKSGFQLSFGDTNFGGILTHLDGIKQNLINIFTDGKVVESANNMINQIAKTLGQAVGSIARIGTNIAEGIIGSIDNYLSQNADRIKDFLVSMFDITSKDLSLTGDLWQVLGEISDVFSSSEAKEIGSNIYAMFYNPLMSAIEVCSKFVTDLKAILIQPIIDNADKIKQTMQNLLTPIKNVTGTLAEAWTYVGDKWNEVYDNAISPFMESIKTGLSDTFGKFLDVYNEYIVPFITYMSESLGVLWEEHLKPLADNIGAFLSSLMELLTLLWENILKPLIDWIVANIIPVLVPIFESIWNTIKNVFGSISDAIGGIINVFKGLIDFIVGIFTGDWNKAWEGIKTFFTGIWDAIKGVVSAVWNAISGIVTTAINVVKGAITTAFNGIKSFISTIWNAIANTISNVWDTIKTKVKEGVQGAWNAITSVFGNVANWFKDKFTQAWQNVKNIFSSGGKIFDGIKDGIANTFKTIVNGIIGGINKVIKVPFDAINKTLNRIKDASFLGIAPFQNMWGYNPLQVPQIPLLAQGGFVKANTPQLAIIGDNKTQGEVVAPENKMVEMIMTALKLFKDDMSTEDSEDGGAININVFLDGELIQRKTQKRNDRLALATNGRCY